MEQEILQKEEALFLPFMQIASGHHHVADTLMHELQNCTSNLTCNKVDILSYSFGRMERIVSSTYLAWIKLLPAIYDRLYHHMAYKKTSQRDRNYFYETLFTYFLRRLINENKPRIIFFTHALPSNIASVLKQKKQLNAVTVNVYTDFFVNRIWGIDGIDYHFAPSVTVKDHLLEIGVNEERIFITGIPIDPIFMEEKKLHNKKDKIAVLVTGGNLGVGGLKQLLSSTTTNNLVHYFVLCGKNEALYEQLVYENKLNITPFTYITCREKMNDLYNLVDGVLTKPGGVTVSECLMKRKPIFIYDPLPGQEKINVVQLKQLGVVVHIDSESGSVEQQIIAYFTDSDQQKNYQKKMDEFHLNLETRSMSVIMEELLHSSLHSS